MGTFGAAWATMGVTLGFHVVDEAATDFLASYNPIAARIRSHLRGIPFPPVFTFWPWFLSLLAAVTIHRGFDSREAPCPRRDQRPLPAGVRDLAALCSPSPDMTCTNLGAGWRTVSVRPSPYLRLGQLDWNRSTSVLPAAEWLAATTEFPPTR